MFTKFVLFETLRSMGMDPILCAEIDEGLQLLDNGSGNFMMIVDYKEDLANYDEWLPVIIGTYDDSGDSIKLHLPREAAIILSNASSQYAISAGIIDASEVENITPVYH